MSEIRSGSAAQKRQVLLAAASAEIVENGYAAASLASIATRLGVTKGALAYHFPAKRDLLVALIERMHQTVDELHSASIAAFPQGGVRALISFLALATDWAGRDPFVPSLIIIDSDASTRQLGLPAQFSYWAGVLAGYLEQAVESGECALETDPMRAAEELLSVMVGSYFYLRQVPDRIIGPRLRFLRTTLRGLGVPDLDEVMDEVLEALR